jgi:glycosyltransferase involved in cell wall biosynthesis
VTIIDNHIDFEPRILQEPPVIEPVPEGVSRPMWSVMIPVYNCSQYLQATIQSVLIQDRGEALMQIEVVDDCSTDADIEKIVREAGKGRVGYFRQAENVGSLKNFRTCLQRSTGHLIHLLHGDDCVKDGFYKRAEALYNKYPTIGAAFCRYTYVDDAGKFLLAQTLEMEKEGVLDNCVERLCERQKIQYVAMTVRREVYETLGGFYGAEYGEDWEMWVRIAAHYPIGYIPDILAEYRRHLGSISGRSFLTAKNMKELAWVMNKIKAYLPPEKQEIIINESKKFYSHYAIKIANRLWKDLRHRSGAAAQVKAAWNMQKDVFLFYKIVKLFTRMMLNI